MTNFIILIGILITLNVQGQVKINPRIDLEYFKEDSSTHYLKVKVRKKIEKRFEPLENMKVNLGLDRAGEPIELGTIITNTNGEGRLNLSERFHSLRLDLDVYQFIANVLATAETEEASEATTIIPGELKISLEDGQQKLIKISLQSGTPQNQKPVEGAEVKVFIKRTFGKLQIGEDFYTTDENGEIEVLFEEKIPGDTAGNIILGSAVEDNEDLGNISSSTKAKWGIPLKQNNDFDKRSLWATRDKTPFWLLILPNLLIAGAWSVIVYLIIQIFKIKHAIK